MRVVLKVKGHPVLSVFCGSSLRIVVVVAVISDTCFVDLCIEHVTCLHQDSDDEGNDDNDAEEKPVIQREFIGRSPSPPPDDSEPEMTEEEKEFQLVGVLLRIFLCILTVASIYANVKQWGFFLPPVFR